MNAFLKSVIWLVNCIDILDVGLGYPLNSVTPLDTLCQRSKPDSGRSYGNNGRNLLAPARKPVAY